MAAPPLDRVDERRLLAADEGAGSHLDHDLETEAAVQDVAAEETVGPGCGDRLPQAPHRERILGPDVDVGLGGADRVGRDRDPFEPPMGGSLDDGPGPDRSGIPLVRVADQVALSGRRGEGESPLPPRHESTAAPAPQAAQLDRLHHFRRRLLPHDLRQGTVTSAREIVVDRSGIADPAVGQNPARLRREERVLVQVRPPGPGLGPAVTELPQESLGRDLSLEDSIEESLDAFLGHGVEAEPIPPRELDVEQRLERTDADAADFDHRGLDTLLVQPGPNGAQGPGRSRAQAAGSGPDEDHGTRRMQAQRFLPPRADRSGAGLALVAERPRLEAGDQVRTGALRGVPAAVAAAGKDGDGDRRRFANHGSPPSAGSSPGLSGRHPP